MHSSFDILGSSECMAAVITNNVNHSSNKIYAKEGEKKWLPALVKFAKQVYNY